jgi:predicted regulator of Ras-like GTPase activity (Roadblock/LC7/MglB family)
MPGDVRPLKLHVELASRCGAWGEARRILARLLEHLPGDPATEARFRTVAALADTGKTVDQALREVEKTGHLAGEDGPTEPRTSATNKSIRPLLKRLIQEDGVEAAFFVRGATALVQGKKGATAERTARGVRDIVSSCRTAARKLGLGQAHEVRIEGEFGTLLVAPSEQGSGALWCLGGITRRHDECLRELAGAALNTPEEEA